VKTVLVTHPAPGHRPEYDRVFGVPIMFESDRNAILVDRSWEDRRIALQPRYVFGVLSGRAEALLKKLEMAKSTRGQVELHLMPILHTGEASMHRIATLMGVSRWTLARRLKAEDVTFEALLDDLRRTLALDYLSGRRVSVNQTAYLLGFSEPAAFSRAFKRWTGKNPRSVQTRDAS
jgi:AraC-like DNA-binding protein